MVGQSAQSSFGGWADFHVDGVRNRRRVPSSPRSQSRPVGPFRLPGPQPARPGRTGRPRPVPTRAAADRPGPHSTTVASSSSQVVASRRRWINALRRLRSLMAAILARTSSSGRPSFRRPRLSKISRASSTFPSASPSAPALGPALGLALGAALAEDVLIDGRFLDPADAQDHRRDLLRQLLNALGGMIQPQQDLRRRPQRRPQLAFGLVSQPLRHRPQDGGQSLGGDVRDRRQRQQRQARVEEPLRRQLPDPDDIITEPDGRAPAGELPLILAGQLRAVGRGRRSTSTVQTGSWCSWLAMVLYQCAWPG